MERDYGILISPPVELQRRYFKEMVTLRGVFCKYQYPLQNKQYTTQGELDTSYSDPIKVGCIFNENLDQKTAKKLGWNAELQDQMSVISVPYDLENLQVGCLFEIPAAFDGAEGRLFRVVEMYSIAIYPASITCRLVPEYKTTMERAETEMFVNTDFNLLNQEDEEHFRWKY